MVFEWLKELGRPETFVDLKGLEEIGDMFFNKALVQEEKAKEVKEMIESLREGLSAIKDYGTARSIYIECETIEKRNLCTENIERTKNLLYNLGQESND